MKGNQILVSRSRELFSCFRRVCIYLFFDPGSDIHEAGLLGMEAARWRDNVFIFWYDLVSRAMGNLKARGWGKADEGLGCF